METYFNEITNSEAKRIATLNEMYASCEPKNTLVLEMRKKLLRGELFMTVPYETFSKCIVNQEFNRTPSKKRVNELKNGLVKAYETYGSPFFNVAPILVNVVTGEISDGGTRMAGFNAGVDDNSLSRKSDIPVYFMAQYPSKAKALTKSIHNNTKNWTAANNLETAMRENPENVIPFFKWASERDIFTYKRKVAIRLATILTWERDRYNEFFKSNDKCSMIFNTDDALRGETNVKEVSFIAKTLNNITDSTCLGSLAKAWFEVRGINYDFRLWEKYLNKTNRSVIAKFCTSTTISQFRTFLLSVKYEIEKDFGK